MNSVDAENAARIILTVEGHNVQEKATFESPDFQCSGHCKRGFEVKSIGKNNDKVGFKIGQLQTFLFHEHVTVLVIDRRTKGEVLRFNITNVESNQ